MIHLADISWFQLLLIEIGALLQVLAICAYVKDAAANRGLAGHHEADANADAQDEETETSKQVARFQADQEHDGAKSATSNAVHLVRTAKVKFVQSFKFREQDNMHHFGDH